MQLLGGIWIAQIFPSVIVGVFTRWLHPWALFADWSAAMAAGTRMAWSLGLESSVYLVPYLGSMYPPVPAPELNLLIAAIPTPLLRDTPLSHRSDSTAPSACVG